MLIYLPKSRASYLKQYSYGHYYGNRFKREEYWKLMNSFLLFMFLIFAVRIGLIIASTGGSIAKRQPLKITAPEAISTKNIERSKYTFRIYIDRINNLVIDDKTIKSEKELIKVLDKYYNKIGNYKPYLWVDEGTEMWFVENVIRTIKKVGYEEITFFTTSKLY